MCVVGTQHRFAELSWVPKTEWQGEGLSSKVWAVLRSHREVGCFLLSSHIPNLSH